MAERKKHAWARLGGPGRRPFRPVPPPPPSRNGPAGTVAWVVLVMLLVGAVAAKAWDHRNQPDPHYVTALELIEGYETGRLPEELNYADPLYRRVLDELALVDGRSVSAQPARALESEIRSSIEEFERLRQEVADRFEERRERGRERRAALVRSHHQGQLDPVRAEDHCEDD